MKRFLSVFLAALMLVSPVAFNQVVSSKNDQLTIQAHASAGVEGELQFMSPQYAKAFIGFLYNKSKVTDEMMNTGGVYTFLTGGFERGSIEELGAEITLLETAKNNITGLIKKFSSAADKAYEILYDACMEYYNSNINNDDFIDDVLEDIIKNVAGIATIMGNGVSGPDIWDEASLYINSLTPLKDLPEKIEDLKFCINSICSSAAYTWTANKAAMYEYVDGYIANRDLKDCSSEAFDLLKDYNRFALVQNTIFYDPILDWASDDHVAVLETFGEFLYLVGKRLENVDQETYDTYASKVKTLEIHCPTDVYVYDHEGQLVLSIVDDEIRQLSDNVYAAVYDSQKIVALTGSEPYDVSITATDDGSMDYKVTEFFGDATMRYVSYEDVPLTSGASYSSSIPTEIYSDADNYNLISEDGNTVSYDYDSLPPIGTDVVDVIVAEELFEGFSTELIDTVANAMFNMRSSVDVSSYLITVDDIMGLFSAIQKYYPSEYSIMSKTEFSYKAIVNPNKGIVTGFRFYYDADVSLPVFQKRVRDLQEEIDKLVAKTEGMTDFEKALFVHDYIILNCEYDYELLEYMEQNQGIIIESDYYNERYSEYSVLVNGTGVCGSYALAYRAVLNAAGMECLYLSSEEMNHAWNLVKINGNWYHCDLTWDDTGYGNDYHYGIAERTYFLRTDEEIMNLNHRSWTPGQYKATSTAFSVMQRYEDRKQKYDGDKWYYLHYGTLYSVDVYGANRAELSELTASAIDVSDGIIYYANGRNIYRFDPETGASSIVYFLPKNKCGSDPESAAIRNFYIDGENVTVYVQGTDSNGAPGTWKHADLLKTEQFGAVTGLTFDESETSIPLFHTYQLNAQIESTGSVQGLEIRWSTSDASVAYVDQTGVVTGRNVGTASITAECLGFSASCTVNITGDGLVGAIANCIWRYTPETCVLSVSGTGVIEKDENGVDYPWAFLKDEAKEIIIADGITEIGNSAFIAFTNVHSISLPSSLTAIGSSTFEYCSSLQQLLIPNGVTTLGNSCFKRCSALEHVKFGTGITSIPQDCFSQCTSLSEIEWSSSLTEIKDGAFAECGFTNLSIPQSINKLGISAFRNNAAIQTLTIPASITEIPANAFLGCTQLQTVHFPDTLTVIGKGAFQNCQSLEQLNLPSHLTSLQNLAFAQCSALTQVTLPNELSNIGQAPFAEIPSLTVTVSPQNTFFVLENNILYNTEHTRLLGVFKEDLPVFTVPDTVNAIDDYAFTRCIGIQDIQFSSGLKTIGQYAFMNCSDLSEIRFPSTLTNVGEGAFKNCYGLKAVYSPSIDAWMRILYGERNTTSTSVTITTDYYSANPLYYAGNLYINGEILTELIVPSNVSEIKQNAFTGCQSLKKLTIPSNITSVGFYSFEYCRNLIMVDMFGSGTIRRHAFEDCTSLDNFTIRGNADLSFESFDGTDNLLKFLILDRDFTFLVGNGWFSFDTSGINKNAVVYGYSGSKAQSYANKHNMTFVDIEAEPHEHAFFLKDCMAPEPGSDGWKYWECWSGDESYTDVLHDYDEPVSQAATCIDTGKTSMFCKNCGNENILEVIPATGVHCYEKVSATTPTCTQPSVVTYTCKDCGDTYTEEDAAGEYHVCETQVIPPTCTAYGFSVDTCEICGEEFMYDFTSPLGHKLVLMNTTENCTAHGSYIYSCSRCSYREEIAISSETLETETITNPATCTVAGFEKQVCKQCGATVATTILPATGHSFEEDFTTDAPATCTAEGSKSKHCTKCDAKILTETIEALGHDYGEWTVKTPATCTSDGIEIRVCSNDAAHTETRPITAIGHDYGEWTVKVPATCTSDGVEIRVCSHNAAHTETRPITAIGHNYGEWATVKAPSCMEEGVEQKVCKNDPSHIESRSIAKTDHKDANNDNICDYGCGTYLGEPTTDHTDDQGSGRCKYCGKIHTGFFGKLVGFFHSILYFFAHLFGKK